MAHELARAKDLAALEEHCSNQRERMMELWNKKDEFRKDYIRNNEMSILRRFGTLDGRHLGPDEEPPILRRRNQNVAIATPQLSLLKKDLLVGGKPVAEGKAEVIVHAEKANHKSLSLKSQKADKFTLTETTPSDSGKEEVAKQEEEEKPSEVELQRLQEEEEKRKEAEAVRLKEQRRQEEIAKAREAEERKRRNAEKAKLRAEARARKLAEEKEKEREKRARKKAVVAVAAAIAVGGVEDETAVSSNPSNSPSSSAPNPVSKEKNETAALVAKKTAKTRSYPISKTSRQKSLVPPPFRKNRRRIQPWIYGIAGSLVVLLVFVILRLYF